MSQNPYASPESSSSAIGVLSGEREDLRSVAKSQRAMLLCILIQIITLIGQFALPAELRLIASLALFVVGIAGAIFVFSLAMKVYGQALGIILGILTLVPCIGLIVLLVVNQKATTVLNLNGIKVGLLGANVSSI